jgi:hypothetical protein
MNLEVTLAVGAVTAYVIEGFKWLWRKVVAKNMAYDFPRAFYLVAVPTLNVALVPVLALVGFSGYTLPTDWASWGQSLAQVFIAALVGTTATFASYNWSISPMKSYVTTKVKK